jgi:tight adherence protein B
MPVWVLLTLAFLGVFALTTVLFYFLVQAPGDRRRMRTRLEAIQQTSFHAQPEDGLSLLRDEVASELPFLDRLFLQLPAVNELDLWVAQAGVELRPPVLALLSIVFAIGGYVLTFLVGMSFFVCLVVAAMAGTAPFLYVHFLRGRRFRRFEELFPDAMEMLARAVRTGYAVSSAFELISDEMPEPMNQEFRILYEQQNLGLPLREALDNLAVRVPLPDVRIFVTTMQIQTQSGGNLAEILDNLSKVVRERFKIMRQIRIYTAEGRLSLIILTALPPVAGLLFYLLHPSYMRRLFEDPMGHVFIAVALVMQFLGFMIIRKIVSIRV